MSFSLTYEARCDVTPDGASRTRSGRFRRVPRTTTEALPRWARRLLRPRTTIAQDEWHDPWADGTRVYDIVASAANVPVTSRGQGPVNPAGVRGCRYHLDLDVPSTAPVTGRRPETVAVERLDRTATGEPELGARRLAQRV